MTRLFIVLAVCILAAIQPAVAQTVDASQREQILKLLNASLPEDLDDSVTWEKAEVAPNGELCFVFIIHEAILQDPAVWNENNINIFKKSLLSEITDTDEIKAIVRMFGKNIQVKMLNDKKKLLARISVAV